MTSVVLLEQLKAFTEKIMADMILPVAMQQGDTEQAYRAPEVYLMRLPDSRSAKKKAPYIIHRVIPLETEQQPGSEERTGIVVSELAPKFDRVYVAATEETLPQIAAAMEGIDTELVPMTSTAPGEGSYLITE